MNLTNYLTIANGQDAIISVFQFSLNAVKSYTGYTLVDPPNGIYKYPSELAEQLQLVKLAQDSTFNLSSDTYQNIVIRAGIVNNVNGTVSALQARVRSVLDFIPYEFEMLSLSQATPPVH